jgi:hypothetical protein
VRHLRSADDGRGLLLLQIDGAGSYEEVMGDGF